MSLFRDPTQVECRIARSRNKNALSLARQGEERELQHPVRGYHRSMIIAATDNETGPFMQNQRLQMRSIVEIEHIQDRACDLVE
jgi:hypothetical protein